MSSEKGKGDVYEALRRKACEIRNLDDANALLREMNALDLSNAERLVLAEEMLKDVLSDIAIDSDGH